MDAAQIRKSVARCCTACQSQYLYPQFFDPITVDNEKTRYVGRRVRRRVVRGGDHIGCVFLETPGRSNPCREQSTRLGARVKRASHWPQLAFFICCALRPVNLSWRVTAKP